ncbi:hypothetical protein ABZZ79_32545 [Streptomyces sp. NPDC006458]|uniref:hypothetical protein n=1 Tax=Streptomyces sp. NPDC006458 TaxID=3154302 RepID=UPI0033B15B3E
MPKLNRLARSVPDARDIDDSLVARGVKLSLGGSLHDPADPMGKMFFQHPGHLRRIRQARRAFRLALNRGAPIQARSRLPFFDFA